MVKERKINYQMKINKMNTRVLKRITSLGLVVTMFTSTGSMRESYARQLNPIVSTNISSDDGVPLASSTVDMIDESIPIVYLEQMSKVGIDIEKIETLKELELHVVKGQPLNWLFKCQSLQRLSLVLEETPDQTDFELIGNLLNLQTLSISCKKCEYFEDYEAYEQGLRNHQTGVLFHAINSGYLRDQKCYYIEYVPNVELNSFMGEFISHMPNLSSLAISSFLYTKSEDLTWIANTSSLTSLNINPYFEKDWNLNEALLAIINNNPFMNSLNVQTNGYRLTIDDYELIKSLNKTSMTNICFQGVYKDSFRYTKEANTRTLLVGLADKLDYDELNGIDIIDFSQVGIYYALIYMSEQDYDYIKEQGITVVFGQDYTENDFRKLAKNLDQISTNLNIPIVASEQMRLNIILRFILDSYHYGPVDKSIDLENKYYKNGVLYACFAGNELICGNYAALLNALLYRHGIESYYIRNNNHAWVLAKIDGQYYYIDPTMIDSIYDSKVYSGFEKNVAFNEVLKSNFYLLNPLDIKTQEIQLDCKEIYKDAKIPYDLDIYVTVNKQKNVLEQQPKIKSLRHFYK